MDFYGLLGIHETASNIEIKNAFRLRAKLFHPDINTDSDASEKFRMLYIAYDTLIDPIKRKMYDQLLKKELTYVDEWVSKAEYEKNQRRAAMRARMYANMQYDKFEARTFSKTTFHVKQAAAFIIFFSLLVIGMLLLHKGYEYVFIEDFNGARITGYAIWGIGGTFCYISGRSLLGIFEAWRLGGNDD